MKLLLTGDPHAGKSTLLNKILQNIDRKQGFITAEMTKNGQRTGFELVSSDGRKALLADINSESDVRVSRYGINVSALDEFLDSLTKIDKHILLYIDEIGQMQLYSGKFQRLASQYLESSNNFIGTISNVYDHEFIRRLKSDHEIEIIEVTPVNRDRLAIDILTKLK